MISAVYGGVARLRRSWYSRPEARARLSRPVISVGNLAVGGSGKTPVVAALATLLGSSGERPAVLTRGYARRDREDGVVVVSDGRRVLVTVEQSGDEPLMLARTLPGVPILVSPDRRLAGQLAERRFDTTVHILDDGFQHLQLARDVDLLLADASDLDDRVLPMGRLREPLSAARAADAVLVYGPPEEAEAVRSRLGVGRAFTVTRSHAALEPLGDRPLGAVARVLAVAAIARPERFVAALRDRGLEVAGESLYRDHHWFSASDVETLTARARGLQVDAIVTTAKDAMRLERVVDPAAAPPWAVLPMTVAIEPSGEFTAWLRSRLGVPR